ncbi:MAG: chemotaxis protein CheA [Proteobacteria bacterium]|nr:chemotaxis protein CheA [Pseudomonadota bacterium]
MTEEEDSIKEIQDSFLMEAHDLLSKVESLSLSIERDRNDIKAFEELARLAHNFKGSGKAVGFDHISKFAHKIEDYILAIRHKEIRCSTENLDLLFKCLDVLNIDIQKLMINRDLALDYDANISEIETRLHSSENSELSLKIDQDISTFESTLSDKASTPTNFPLLKKASVTPSGETPNLEASKEAEKHKNNTQTEFLRVAKSKIDYLVESFGEQVILQSMLEQNKFNLGQNQEILAKAITQLSKLTFELQNHALSLTMIQLFPTFTKLERAVRDAAKQCNKKVVVVLNGAETEVGKPLIEALSDPLTHMVRNAVDHAIEASAKRLAKGKPEEGKVIVSAWRSGGQFLIEIIDDGKGMDPQLLKSKAIDKGLISASDASLMPDSEAFKLIFENGFSTKDQVSELSGRGVGMNVVSETVKSLNGSIEIESVIDKGTCLRLKLPLSMAIFNGAVIKVNGSRYVVPNSEISEIFRISPDAFLKMSDTKFVVRIRDEIFQVIDLRKCLNNDLKPQLPLSPKVKKPLILSRKHGNKAFLIDEVIGMQKIVQKQIGDEIKSRPSYVAGTILSDGTPGVVLSLEHLGQVG